MVFPILKLTLIPAVKLWIRRVNGLENIPKKMAFILAANHLSYMDHLMLGSIIASYFDRKVHFLAKKEYFENSLSKAWHTYVGGVPIDRKSGGKEALKAALKALNENKIIGVYPEGTRTLTGKIQKAKTGVAKLALLSKDPVLPIGLIGTFEILPKGKYIPRFKKATINIGKPMYFPEYYGRNINKRILSEVTARIMKEIARLSGQEYNF